MTITRFLLASLMVVSFTELCMSQSPPSISGWPKNDLVFWDEDQPSGTTLFTFSATHPNNEAITIETSDELTAQIVFINQTHGSNINVQVITQTELDRDGTGLPGTPQVQLNFIAKDISGNVINKRASLYINDINDNVPVFLNQPYTWEIRELPFNANAVYTRVKAIDRDDNKNGTRGIRYFMEPLTQSDSTADEYRNTFEINFVTGDVKIKKSVDYEKNSYYQFNLTARDREGAGRTGDPADFIIRVLDVQDTPPFFLGQPYRKTIPENVNLNKYVLTVNARDGDTGVSNPVNYTVLPGKCSTLFNISKDGEIRTAAKIDRDIGDVHEVDGVCVLTILVQEEDKYASDQHGNTTATTEVTITIEDVNDNPPEFVNTTYIAEVQENTPPNVPITLKDQDEIKVFDKDQGINARISLSLQYRNGSDCKDFSIAPTIIQKNGSALIRVVNSKLLDYEQINTTEFLIIASETTGNMSATSTVLLSILDMNDNNPQFQNTSYTFSVPENSDNGTSVGTIIASDADSGDFGKIKYSISGGNNRFIVNKTSGVIYTLCSVCSTEFDREKVDVYYMTYTATDGGGRSNSRSLVIHITDKNDNAPEFTRKTYSNYIEENDARYNETDVIELEAQDKDEENTNNSVIIYRIINITEPSMNGNISLNNATGRMYLLHAVDFEKLSNKSGIIDILVEARDLGEPSLANNATVTITVQDMNDNNPVFNDTLLSAEITENSTSNATCLTPVGSVFASDADGTERNNKVQYFIISGAMDHFMMNASTGMVYVQINQKLNRETIPDYNITVAAIDQGSPPRTGTTVLHVEVIDVNDEIPKFDQLEYNTAIFENQTGFINESIITCKASDSDINNELEYSISVLSAKDENLNTVNESLVKNYFDVHRENGTVYVKSLPDREVAKTVRLRIKVEDLQAYEPRPQTATAHLTITLQDINDNNPEFEGLPYIVNVSENAQNPTILRTIRATDKDENRTIKYTLLNTSYWSGAFDIHPESGVLRKIGTLDREDTAEIILRVNATDNGEPPLTSTTNVTVIVFDFNDNSPEFLNFTTEIALHENATKGHLVVNVTATDKDYGSNANVTYTIEEGADGKFIIDTITGEITVNDILDREDKATYSLRIKAQDNPLTDKELSTLKIVTINLLDINDQHPEFEKTMYQIDVLETAAVGSSIAKVVALDDDQPGTNNSKISYIFSNNTSPPGLFRIDKDTGVIHVNKSLQGFPGSYILELIATDWGQPMLRNNKSSAANITILDENLNAPEITNMPPNNLIKVYECVDDGYELYHFNYTDADIGINAKADFNISEIDDSIFDTFEMLPSGVLRVIAKLNALDKPMYRFQVQVIDKGTPVLSSEKQTITVEVIDVDDHLPSFTEEKIPFGVKENEPIGVVVGTVTAVDKDLNSIPCYKIIDGNWSTYFDIGENNGSIVTKKVLDYETQHSHQIEVEVEDCTVVGNASDCENVTREEGPDHRNNIFVTVNVIDVNDNPPVFQVGEIAIGMKRTTEVNVSLDISLKTNDYIRDNDSNVNGRQAWVFSNAGDITTSASLSMIHPYDGYMECPQDKKKHVICVSRNGSLINNKYYSEDISGYFIVPVNVSDKAGSDSVNVKIFLIGDSQILVMTLLGPKEEIAEKKNEIMKLYSQVTGHTFVYDWLEDHKTPDGRVETFKTDLYFHIVNGETGDVLSAQEGIRVVDRNYDKLLHAMQFFQVLQVEASVKEISEDDNSVRTVYIMAAVIAVLVVTVAIIIYVSITTRNAYTRKLKAATVSGKDMKEAVETDKTIVPGSNQYSRQANPLLNKEIPEKIEYDNMSMGSNNSLDLNSVGDPRGEDHYDKLEEKEARIDLYMEIQPSGYDPLDAALKQYDMQNIHNKQDNVSTEGIVSPSNIEALAFENAAYEGGFESTEI